MTALDELHVQCDRRGWPAARRLLHALPVLRLQEADVVKKHGGYFDRDGVAHNSAWFARESKRRRKASKQARRARRTARSSK